MASRTTLITVCLMAALPSLAESLGGRVSTVSGAPVPGASVTALSGGRVVASASSGPAGDWTLEVPAGRYTVSAEAPGFETKRVRGVSPGGATAIVLKASEEKAVRYQPVVDVERTHQSDFVSERQLANLPVNRRNYLSLAALTPGVSRIDEYVGISDAPLEQAPQSGLSFGGNSRGNVFWLDGGENYINTGAARPSISQEAVSEFQVWRSNYSAEFGGGIGGIVNIISKSGTNDIHGDLFGYLRHRAFQARNFFDPEKLGYTRSQIGGTLSAPIRKNRTFAFAAFERLQSRESAFVAIGREDRGPFRRLRKSQDDIASVLIATQDPSLALLGNLSRQLLLTTNFPATLGLFRANRGVFPFGESVNQGSLRVDHRFSDNHNAFFRFNAATGGNQNSQLEGIAAFSRGVVSDFSDQTFLVNDTWVLSANFVSESRLLLNRTRFNARNRDTLGPSIDINGYGLFGKDWTLPTDFGEWHGQLQQNFFVSAGPHSIRFGADINPVRAAALVQANFGGRFTFGEYLPLGAFFNGLTGNPNMAATVAGVLAQAGRRNLINNLETPLTAIQAFNIGAPSAYIQGFGDPSWQGWFQRYNFFFNDVVRISPRLTLNAGVRYELEAAPSGLGTDPNNAAPRIGLAWDPAGDRKTVLRAGYGLFYLRHQSQIAAAVDTQSGQRYNQVVVPLSGLPGSRNAATGAPVNSSDIYRTLTAQGVIGRRAIAASDLAQFGIVPGRDFPYRILFQKPHDFVNAWAHQASVEIERAVGATSILAGYNFNRGAHLPRLRDTNLAYGPLGKLGEPSLVPLDPLQGQRLVYESAANSFYHAFFLQGARRFARRATLNAHYTFAKSIDESTDIQFLPHDSLNTRRERGLSTFDQRHRLVASGVLDLPARWGGITLAPIVTAASGHPFNVVTGLDFNSRRPAAAGRNIGLGPGFFAADLRASRSFALSRSRESLRLEVIAEGFNLTNRTNFKRLNNTVGDVTVDELPRPLRGTLGEVEDPLSFVSAFPARQLQFAVKLRW
ncbi:MAG: TonB-dependent receptor [Bryobacteraceae bacterium]